MSHPPAILCIGRNYASHANEMGSSPPSLPTVFMKNPASIIGPTATIEIPPICHDHGPQVDYEGELAIVIAHDCCDVVQDEAMSCVGGYAVANDVTARWWQKQGSGGQWIRGKSFDTFCPMTKFVQAAEIPDPQSLRIITRVDGIVMQDGSTAEMIFSIADLITELSRGMTLLAGTIILTGTPEGVGAARTPPRFLENGDLVEVEIEGVGMLKNLVSDPGPN